MNYSLFFVSSTVLYLLLFLPLVIYSFLISLSLALLFLYYIFELCILLSLFCV